MRYRSIKLSRYLFTHLSECVYKSVNDLHLMIEVNFEFRRLMRIIYGSTDIKINRLFGIKKQSAERGNAVSLGGVAKIIASV